MNQLLERMGTAVINERRTVWERLFGDAVDLPEG
jgi:hypothetical protein